MTPDFKYNYSINADGACIALIPVELIWTEDVQFLDITVSNYTADWAASNALYGAKPMLRLRTHLELFDYYSLGGPFPREYLNWYKSVYTTRGLSPSMDDGQILEYRLHSFRTFTEKLAAPSDWLNFFAADAVFDLKRNCFVLKDGHHRCCFLQNRGLREIPLKISFYDLQSWLNLPMAWYVDAEIRSQGRTLVYSPLLNPMLMGPKPVRDFYYKSRLDHILTFFGPKPFPKRMIDIGCNTGFFSFHLTREGGSVVGCDTDANHIALARELSGLYNLKPEFIHAPADEVLEEPGEYDAAIFLTVLYHLISAGTHARLLSLINSQVRDFIIWESGDDPQHEIAVITGTTKFVNYLKIACTYGTGKSRELGLFYREGWMPPRRGSAPII